MSEVYEPERAQADRELGQHHKAGRICSLLACKREHP